MGLDVYLRRDVAHNLRAAAMSSEAAITLALDGLSDPAKQNELRSYRRGYMAALVTLGLSFGLEPETGANVQQIEKGKTAIPTWTETER